MSIGLDGSLKPYFRSLVFWSPHQVKNILAFNMFKLLALSSVATICALSAGRQARKENKRLRKQLVAKFSADEERTSTWKEAMEERDAEVCDAKRRHQDAERKCRILEGEVEELKLHVLRGDDKCRSLEDKVV